MNKKIYKKFLKDRLDNIKSTLESLKNRLDHGEISYPEFLYIESNLYNDMIVVQHELKDLDRKAVI